MQGLAGVESAAPYDGMFFDFGCVFNPIMTPKGLLFPVDVAFIDLSLKIVEIRTLDPNLGLTQASLEKDVQFVLEVPLGFFKRYGISLGYSVINNIDNIDK